MKNLFLFFVSSRDQFQGLFSAHQQITSEHVILQVDQQPAQLLTLPTFILPVGQNFILIFSDLYIMEKVLLTHLKVKIDQHKPKVYLAFHEGYKNQLISEKRQKNLNLIKHYFSYDQIKLFHSFHHIPKAMEAIIQSSGKEQKWKELLIPFERNIFLEKGLSLLHELYFLNKSSNSTKILEDKIIQFYEDDICTAKDADKIADKLVEYHPENHNEWLIEFRNLVLKINTTK